MDLKPAANHPMFSSTMTTDFNMSIIGEKEFGLLSRSEQFDEERKKHFKWARTRRLLFIDSLLFFWETISFLGLGVRLFFVFFLPTFLFCYNLKMICELHSNVSTRRIRENLAFFCRLRCLMAVLLSANIGLASYFCHYEFSKYHNDPNGKSNLYYSFLHSAPFFTHQLFILASNRCIDQPSSPNKSSASQSSDPRPAP